jgi:serine/tyrosine/threonine adenylyltransferase
MTYHFPFNNSYARLPERFYARVSPTSARTPKLIRLNRALALELGLDADWLAGPEGLEVLAGKSIAEGSEPIATAYAGHQFGHFVPQLGDGRAILLGEVVSASGKRHDVQLKGSGPTPFSRMADGKAALGPVLREYVVSEGMHALGIPTTRALAAVTTGDTVMRETIQPGAALVRVASSHIRVGTFQFFAVRGDTEGVRLLADHVIARHYPEAASADRPYRALLDAVIAAQARLIPQWMLVGFIHGVMNTDNMSIAGETIDYGPCAFMDEYHPGTVFSSIDEHGRYAYVNQPQIALWNLTRFAETLLPLLDDDQDAAVGGAQAALAEFKPVFEQAYLDGFRRKLGLVGEDEEDAALISALLEAMALNRVDFTLFFRRLADAQAEGEGDEPLHSLFADPAAYHAWIGRWRSRLQRDGGDPAERRAAMRAANPAFIPRNHRVEAVIRAAVDREDFGPFNELVELLSRPFDDQPGFEHYVEPPKAEERVLATFCGT